MDITRQIAIPLEVPIDEMDIGYDELMVIMK